MKLHQPSRTLVLAAILMGLAVIYTWRQGQGPSARVEPERIAQQPVSTPLQPSIPAIPSEPPPKTQSETLTGQAAQEKLRKDGQYESLGAAFQAARYAVEKINPTGPHSRGAEYFAANPGQQLRAWFFKDGVELASGIARQAGGNAAAKGAAGARLANDRFDADKAQRASVVLEPEPWRAALRLREAGRAGSLRQVAANELRAEGGRVEMTDPAAGLIQWFENRKEGIEQGFTLNDKPPGAGAVEVVMSVEGTLRAEALANTESGVRFVTPTGAEVLRYAGLKAWDAAGRTLPGRIELRGQAVALLIADADAQYPVTIDPLFINLEKRLTEDSLDFDLLGTAVALSGETALVGASSDETAAGLFAGCAYIFVRNGSTWQQQAKLIATNGAPFDNFGYAVALSGETALVGAYFRNTTAGDNAGSAFVFVRSGTTWSQQAELRANDGAPGDVFGRSVAIHNDTAVIGAPGRNSGLGEDVGKAYVFTRTNSVWSVPAPLVAGDPEEDDQFGFSVAVDGNSALVGATMADSTTAQDSGAAYVFLRNGSNWDFQQKLMAGDGALQDLLGYSVALSGDTAIVGAPADNTTGGTDAGSVTVFFRTVATWNQQGAKLIPADGATDDYFGFAVSLSGDTAVIGAPNDDTNAGFDAGSGYFYTRSSGVWSQQGAKVTSAVFAQEASFGASVAVSTDTAIFGVPNDDTAAGEDAGSASVFLRTNSVWNRQAQLTAGDSAALDYFGFAVSLDGDTAVVGAPFDDGAAGQDVGSAYVFRRAVAGWNQQARLTANDGAAFDRYGLSVAVNGDTALVGAQNHNTSAGSGAGAVYVYVRSGTNWSQQGLPLVASDGAASDSFGNAVALAGDTALIGASNDNTPAGADAGSAYVFVRNSGAWSQQMHLFSSDPAAGDSFGYSVSISGETALVGAVSANLPDASDAGAAYVFVRTGTTWGPPVKLVAIQSRFDADFGYSVAVSGDTALVGARLDQSIPGTTGGSAYVFVRSGTAWNPQTKLTASDAMASDEFGASVALSGDTAIIGAPGDDDGDVVSAGGAYLFTRSGTNWNPQRKLTAGLDSSSVDLFGASVALSGDTALVGAYLEDTAANDAGSAYIFLIGELPEITLQPISRTVIPGVSVTFTVEATGYAPLQYQWRKNGFLIHGANSSSHTVPSVQLADAGNYDVVVANVGGTVTSAAAVLGVNALSQFTQNPPGAPLAAQGSVLVNLSLVPPASNTALKPAWRFVGEQEWRVLGVAVAGLTSGNRRIEFRPVNGYFQPSPELIEVQRGAATTVLSRDYVVDDGSRGSGGLKVTLKPDGLAGAEWRLLGEDDTRWRESGVTATGLTPGFYLVECKPVTARATPPPLPVTVNNGPATPLTATYFLAATVEGVTPAVVPFETVTAAGPLPYRYVGQIRSGVGVSTGFVVKRRVVATAGHVVFDDGTLSAVTDLQWLFQRDRGTYEPKPQIPRGSYVLAGYAASRTGGVPGESSSASQNLDAAALYFMEETAADGALLDDGLAGRGGFGGFLASDAVDNEFLGSSELKTLVGYPVDTAISPANRGRVHATPPANLTFTRLPNSSGPALRTYRTADVASYGGNSGGPLCVQFEGGNYYPAAIYLGGTAETVVRAIDGAVVDLFDRAEVSGNGGDNNTGGGVTRVDSDLGGSNFSVSALQVVLNPAAGASWKIAGDAISHPSNFRKDSLVTGTVQLSFTAPPGYLTPPPVDVTLAGNTLSTLTRTFFGITVPPQKQTIAIGSAVTFRVSVSGRPSAYQWLFKGNTIAGATNPTYTRSNLSTADEGEYSVRVTWQEGASPVSQESAGAQLIVAPAGQLVVNVTPSSDGSVTINPSRPKNLYVLGEKVTLTAKPKTKGVLFAGWQIQGGAEKASPATPTTGFKMTELVMATASFVPNPFPARADSYAGRIGPASGVSLANTGTIALKVTNLGVFSGTLQLGGSTYRVRGQFDANGRALSVSIPRPGLSDLVISDLQLDLSADGNEQITGKLSLGSGLAFTLDRSFFDKKNPSPQARTSSSGKAIAAPYTVIFQRDPTDLTNPQGHGFGVATVKPDGAVRFVGTLGDGTGLTHGAVISKTGEWPFHASLYKSRGVVNGALRFRAVAGVSDLDGTLEWIKPAIAGDKTTYPGGFTARTTVIGARYDKTTTLPSGTFSYGQGNLGITPAPVPFTSVGGRISFDPSFPGVSLQVAQPTGLFRGTLPSVAGPKSIKFRGVIFQKTQRGYGLFKGATPVGGTGLSTGFVELTSP